MKKIPLFFLLIMFLLTALFTGYFYIKGKPPVNRSLSILYIPLDERPFNYSYPLQLSKFIEAELIIPPKNILNHPAEVNDLWKWMFYNTKNVDAAIISLDMLLYGETVPTHTYRLSLKELQEKVNRLKVLKQKNRNLKIYAFQLIDQIPKTNNKEELDNELIFETLKLVKERVIDYLVIPYIVLPKNDSLCYSFNIELEEIHKRIKELDITEKVTTCSGADGLGHALLARAYLKFKKITPMVFVDYISKNGPEIMLTNENRSLSQSSISIQIQNAGGKIAKRISESDFILMVNSPSRRDIEDSVNRIEKYVSENHSVIIADAAFSNGSDIELMKMLQKKGLLNRLSGYSGGNTGENSISTAIAQGMLSYNLKQNSQTQKALKSYLVLRYLDDWGFQSIIKHKISKQTLPLMGLSHFELNKRNDDISGILLRQLREFLIDEIQPYFLDYKIKLEKVYLPLNELSEIGLHIKLKPATLSLKVGDLTLDEKIGQMFMVGLSSFETDNDIKTLIQENKIGNIILFERNIKDIKQLVNLTNNLKTLNNSNRIPLMIATDQEGGKVSRLPEGATAFPSLKFIGDTNDTSLAFKLGRATAQELKAVGINADLAPVLDVNNNPKNPVIGIRSFGNDPELVKNMGIAMMQGMQSAGLITTIKHFPGHGDTTVDSHIGLPTVNHDRSHLDKVEFFPFKNAIITGADMVMTAHIRFPKVDLSGMPATLSNPIISGLLREEFGFNGVVITDALDMGAITKNFTLEQSILNAINAGVDILLVPSYYPTEKQAIKILKDAVRSGRIPETRIDQSVKRILKLKNLYDIKDNKLDPEKAESVLGNSQHRKLLNR